MIQLNYLPIEKENIKKQPNNFALNINENEYGFRVCFNPIDEKFYFNCFTSQEKLIIGRKIVYGVDLMNDVDNIKFEIIPLSETGTGKNGVNYDNFMDDVRLYIFGSDS